METLCFKRSYKLKKILNPSGENERPTECLLSDNYLIDNNK